MQVEEEGTRVEYSRIQPEINQSAYEDTCDGKVEVIDRAQ